MRDSNVRIIFCKFVISEEFDAIFAVFEAIFVVFEAILLAFDAISEAFFEILFDNILTCLNNSSETALVVGIDVCSALTYLRRCRAEALRVGI